MVENLRQTEKGRNPVVVKSFTFSLQIIRTCQRLQANSEYVLSRQLLRSGTSIGANIEEALGALSRRDFIAKLGISYKEARETDYWLRLLAASGYLTEEEATELHQRIQELLRLLGSILKTLRQSQTPATPRHSTRSRQFRKP